MVPIRMRKIMNFAYRLVGDIRSKFVNAKENTELSTTTTDVVPTPDPAIVQVMNQAFSSEKVAEQIFGRLNTSELLNCRLVDHGWNLLATSQLEKRLQLNFDNFKLRRSRNRSGSECGKSLRLSKLTNLLESPLAVRTPFPIPFPCKNFSFNNHGDGYIHSASEVQNEVVASSLSNPRLQKFLTVHGKHIEELTINFSGTGEHNLPDESAGMEAIKIMLVDQAPNLRKLSLSVEFRKKESSKCRKVQQFYQVSNSTKNSSNNQSDKVESQSTSTFTAVFNRNLKVLHLPEPGCISGKMLEFIIALAPSLEEIDVQDMNYIYTLKALNKLSLIKTLWFTPLPMDPLDIVQEDDGEGNEANLDIEALKSLEDIALISEGEESLRFRDVNLLFPDIEGFTEFKTKIGSALTRILECSSETLESIQWEGVTFFNEFGGLKWPQVMPNVEVIHLVMPLNVSRQNVFDPNSNLADTFPKLRRLHLYDEHGRHMSLKYERKMSLTIH